MKNQVLSVSRLVELFRDLLEENFVEVLVEGEISNFARPASGHCYFTLKDERGQLRCAMFRSQSRLLRFTPENGLKVICRGRASVYPQRGELQLVIEGMEPSGVGELQLAFEQLKQKLSEEGLFDSARKQPLPEYPQTVGVVTSASGAAIHDILNVLRRRAVGARVLLRPVRVQGEGAAKEIAAAIDDLNREASCEVLIVGRGGGSLEDLWAFNEEVVARAIAASKIPLVSAVGHEVDFSIADFVADLRAPTPSAAAELVVKSREELERHCDQLTLRLGRVMQGRVELLRSRLRELARRLVSPVDALRFEREQVESLRARLERSLQWRLRQQAERLQQLSERLDDLSPLKVLGRGYALVEQEADGMLLRDASETKAGDRVLVRLRRGRFRACVLDIVGEK